MPPTPSSLFLFTGENTFALEETLKHWKQSFLEKHGESNLQTFEAATLDWQALCNEAMSAPFLGEKRLLIVEGIPNIQKEDLEKLQKNMHESTILVFSDPAPDKRKSLVKFLFKEATVRAFLPLTPDKLIPWVIALGKMHGVDIEPTVAAYLVRFVGTDQWSLKQECLKVIAYAAPESPTIANVEKVCLPNAKHGIWTINDLIGRGKPEEAALYNAKLFASGEDAYSLWNRLLFCIRNISILWIFYKEKNLSGAALAKESGVNFLSVQSLLPLVRTLSREQVSSIVASAVMADKALKSGEIKSTAQNSIELVTMVERQLLGLKA